MSAAGDASKSTVVATGRHFRVAYRLMFAVRMTFSIIDAETLRTTVGGQAAGTQAGTQAAPSGDERTRQIIREEMEQERRWAEKEYYQRWEKSHPLGRYICQGDRDCMDRY
jgi:hypothetical protein